MLGLYVEIEFWGEKIEGCVGVTNGDGGRALKLYLATADGDLSKGPTQLPQTPSGFHADVLNFVLLLSLHQLHRSPTHGPCFPYV